MTATLATKEIKDGAGNPFAQRVLDVSGTGAGPFLPLLGLADPDGEGPVDVAALAEAILAKLAADPATQTTLAAVLAKLNAGLQLAAGAAVIGKIVQQVGGSDIAATNPLPVGGAQLATATATIASGTSLSGGVDLGTGRIAGLIVPAAWTTAAITFQGSADGTSFFDLYDDAIERAIASASVAASRFIALPLADWLSIRAVKLRSGSAAAPVNQGADRVLTLVTVR